MTSSHGLDFAGAETTAMVVILLGVLLLSVIRFARRAADLKSALRSKPREYQRSVLKVCPGCGYDLCASPLLCPECGRENGAVVVLPIEVLQERLAASTRILTHRVAEVRSRGEPPTEAAALTSATATAIPLTRSRCHLYRSTVSDKGEKW